MALLPTTALVALLPVLVLTGTRCACLPCYSAGDWIDRLVRLSRSRPACYESLCGITVIIQTTSSLTCASLQKTSTSSTLGASTAGPLASVRSFADRINSLGETLRSASCSSLCVTLHRPSAPTRWLATHYAWSSSTRNSVASLLASWPPLALRIFCPGQQQEEELGGLWRM